MEKKKHLRVSVATRNASVITAVNNGATSAELAAEYKVKWNTIRDSIRDDHYRVNSRPANKNRYKEFLAKVKANDAAAAVRAEHTANLSKPQANSQNGTGNSPVTVLATPVTTSAAAADNKTYIHLVETGVLLRLGVDHFLALNGGNNIYWIPRFCIKELMHMSESDRLANDPIKDTAKSVLRRIYADDVWDIRFIPFEQVEQGMIQKTPDVSSYKHRSFGVAEAALELYVDSSAPVNVHTTSMEIEHLLTRAVREEKLGGDIIVTRVRTK